MNTCSQYLYNAREKMVIWAWIFAVRMENLFGILLGKGWYAR